MNENVIEWITGEDRVALTLDQKKYINRVRRLSRQHRDVWVHDNADGTIYATMPLSYLKLSAPRQMSAEQREAARQRLFGELQANRE